MLGEGGGGVCSLVGWLVAFLGVYVPSFVCFLVNSGYSVFVLSF